MLTSAGPHTCSGIVVVVTAVVGVTVVGVTVVVVDSAGAFTVQPATKTTAITSTANMMIFLIIFFMVTFSFGLVWFGLVEFVYMDPPTRGQDIQAGLLRLAIDRLLAGATLCSTRRDSTWLVVFGHTSLRT